MQVARVVFCPALAAASTYCCSRTKAELPSKTMYSVGSEGLFWSRKVKGSRKFTPGFCSRVW